MITYPTINPVALSIGPIQIHWYGLMYLVGFITAWLLARFRIKHYRLNWTYTQVDDLIFYSALGVIIGGRLGYALFYDTHQMFLHPLNIFKIWEGGMSFHGGLLGVFIALIFYAKKLKKSTLEVTDFLTPLVPLGLFFGRMGNFINGELWGRVTDVPWAMIFPKADDLPRHPSQLYEATLEGLFLFILVWWYARKPRPYGATSAVFLMGYAICRFIIELYREPDIQLGYIVFDRVTMGQLLSLPMFIAGFFLFIYASRTKHHANLS